MDCRSQSVAAQQSGHVGWANLFISEEAATCFAAHCHLSPFSQSHPCSSRWLAAVRLGRKTQTITPDAGTWNYYYDSVSTPGCPSGYTGAIGLLEAVEDPNGNKLCYKYDSLDRVIGVNANGTTCRNFYYDATYGTVPLA